METSYMHPDVPDAKVRDISRVLREHWKGIILLFAATTVLVLGWSLMQPRIYQSTVTGLVVTTGSTDVASSYAGDNLAKSKAVSYGMLATSEPIIDKVISELRLDVLQQELISNVTVTTPEDSTEVRILVGAEDPERAAAIADTWLRILSDQVREVEGLSDSGDVSVSLVPLGDAAVPREPVSPDVPLNLALGAVVGLILGLLYALIRNKLDHRIHSARDIKDTFHLPVLGVFPTDNRLADHRDIIGTGSPYRHEHDQYSEALRELRTNINHISRDVPPRIIVVTGPLTNEGASSITANLAVAIASTGRDVVVVDGDLRHPVMTDMFNLDSGMGLTDVLLREQRLQEVLQANVAFPRLRVLAGGRAVPNQVELLSSTSMRQLLEDLAEGALVLIDTPPTLSVSDAALLAASADGVIMVVAAERTTREHLAESMDNLGHVHGNVLGVVLNRVPTADTAASFFRRRTQGNQAREKQEATVLVPSQAAETSTEREDIAPSTRTDGWSTNRY